MRRWSVPCTRLHSEEAQRRVEPAQWRQTRLYAGGSPLERVFRAQGWADGVWEGATVQTSSLFRLRAPIAHTLTSLRQEEHQRKMEINCWTEDYCAKLHHHDNVIRINVLMWVYQLFVLHFMFSSEGQVFKCATCWTLQKSVDKAYM